MRRYLMQRLSFMLLVMVLTSIFAFIVIQLPPGDFLNSYIIRLETERGGIVDPAEIEAIKRQFGLGDPMYVQYFKWVGRMFRGDFGQSFEWRQPVTHLIRTRLPLTIGLSFSTLILTYIIAITVGIYSARHQYSPLDYTFTTLGFIGLSTPSFFLALVLAFLLNRYFGVSVGGIQSPQFMNVPASWAKFVDMLKHLPLPIIVIGLAGTASIIRVMRGSLLDEIGRPYVAAARARGLEERVIIYRYPVRVALNPIISTIGWLLPSIFSGATVTAIVLNLPTIGLLLYGALLSQDMFLAGTSIMILTFLTLIGTFISDVLLALIDPRIRYS